MLRRNCLFAAALLTCLALDPDVRAMDLTIKDASEHTQPMRLDVVLGFQPTYGVEVGVGAWFSYPILPDGFIPSLNDTFSLEGGLRWGARWYGVGVCDWTWMTVTPLAGARWDFHLTDAWTVFAKAKVGGYADFADSSSCGIILSRPAGLGGGFAFDFGVGAYFDLTDLLVIRMEIAGIDAGFEVAGGIGFKL